jgi:uncharacterized membrane protein
MESHAAILGHPLHPILVNFPLGLFPTAFLFDLIYLWRKDPFWRRAAFALIVVGELGTLVAIPFGLADYLLIGMPAATRRLATIHLYLGLAVAALYGLQIGLRRRLDRHPAAPPGYPAGLILLTLFSAGAAITQGGIGGDLSHVRRVGVAPAPTREHPGAHPPETPAGGQKSPGTADLAAGRQVFLKNCASCHGASAEGKKGPRLAGNELEMDFIKKTVLEGRWPVMPASPGRLSPAEIETVAAYVHSLGSGH